MNNQPPVSCICLTYGRPAVLEEAIESFLIQAYQGPKELIVLNDYVDQTLHFDHPEVRVINVPKRFHTVGEKMNAAVALAAHDLLFVWDDDDIYLPHRLTFSVEHFDADKGFFKPHEAWILNNGTLRLASHSVYHVASCWSRTLFNEVRGYPAEGTGYDLLFEHRLAERFPGVTAVYVIQPEEIYYLYRWGGTDSYHMSGFGALQEGQNVGHQQVADFVQQRAIRGEIPQGDIPLQPGWKLDYRQLVSSHIRTLAETKQYA
ncbi:MAG: glycosyltransferase family A protein [Caldilineaceae bacterium]